MKLNEIMIIKNDDTGKRLKVFQVDDDTLAKLTRIRGSLYADDRRLTSIKNLPEHKKPLEPGAVISDEMLRRAEESYRAYKENERMATTPTPVRIPEPVLSFDEKVKEDWRTRPDIRAEFISLASYEAYCRAVRNGRCRV